MAKCDYCGKEVSLFQTVKLKDGRVCKDCFHWANYGGYGYDDGSYVQLDGIDYHTKKRNAEVANFHADIETKCGLSCDDSQMVFMYNGHTYSYMSLCYFYSFYEGKKLAESIRHKSPPSQYRNPKHKPHGYSVYVQLSGYTYPSNILLSMDNEPECFECFQFLSYIAEEADQWEEKFDAKMKLMEKKQELLATAARFEREMKEIEQLTEKLNE